MREAKSIFDVKVGSLVVVKNYLSFKDQGFEEVTGEVKAVQSDSGSFSFYCNSTESLETVVMGDADVWLQD
jgi:hypothetical protein